MVYLICQFQLGKVLKLASRVACSWEEILVFKTDGRKKEEDFAFALGTFKKRDTAVSLIKKVNYACCFLKSRSLWQFVWLVPLSRTQFPMSNGSVTLLCISTIWGIKERKETGEGVLSYLCSLGHRKKDEQTKLHREFILVFLFNT